MAEGKQPLGETQLYAAGGTEAPMAGRGIEPLHEVGVIGFKEGLESFSFAEIYPQVPSSYTPESLPGPSDSPETSSK